MMSNININSIENIPTSALNFVMQQGIDKNIDDINSINNRLKSYPITEYHCEYLSMPIQMYMYNNVVIITCMGDTKAGFPPHTYLDIGYLPKQCCPLVYMNSSNNHNQLIVRHTGLIQFYFGNPDVITISRHIITWPVLIL